MMAPAARLKEPGHITPTDRPHKAQPRNPKTGEADQAEPSAEGHKRQQGKLMAELGVKGP